jgi:glycosyltransferase involved in cell wall biosynthesis
MSAADVSVVICAFDVARRDVLARAVASAEGASEVIVVVDHKPDLHAWAAEALPGARVLASTGPRGLAGARNTGVAAATGAVVAFLDDDAEAEPGWLASLCEPYADRGVAGVGGGIVPVWAGERPAWFPEEFDWVVGCSYRGLEPGAVRNLIGANMSLRRELIVEAGGFAPGLGRVGADGYGCEETDLCLRIAARHPDMRFVYRPEARVRHRVTTERARLAYFVARCYGEGRSKRQVVARAGAGDGLASERAHLRRALPAGFRRGLLSGEPAGLARAGAIALGVAAAGAGYATGGRR